MSTKPYDQAFKYLAEQDAESLLILLGHLQPGHNARIIPLPCELGVYCCSPISLIRSSLSRKSEIVHIEAESNYKAIISKRVADYDLRLWIKYQLPVKSYVLLLTDRGLPKRVSTRIEINAGDIRTKSRHQLIRLSRISARKMLGLRRENLLPFVPLMRGGQEELEAGAAAVERSGG